MSSHPEKEKDHEEDIGSICGRILFKCQMESVLLQRLFFLNMCIIREFEFSAFNLGRQWMRKAEDSSSSDATLAAVDKAIKVKVIIHPAEVSVNECSRELNSINF